MRDKTLIFDPAQVTVWYKKPEVLEFHKKGWLIPAIGEIYPGRISSLTNTFRGETYTIKQPQRDILDTFIKHFGGQGIPYAITNGRNSAGEHLTLWKEIRA